MSDLPCEECGGGCCKWNYTVYLTQDEKEWVLSRNPEYVDPSNDYNALLFKDGKCPYLESGKCSIYETRFDTCRKFNCVMLYNKFMEDKNKYKWAFWFFMENPVATRFVKSQLK